MNFWDKRSKDLESTFNNNKENFLRGDSFKRTMHGQNRQLCDRVYNVIKGDKDINLVKDPKFGNPLIMKEGMSQSTLRSLYYFRKIDKMFNMKDIHHVTDFGAGYGNNCRVWHHLGFDGEYFLADLPKVGEVQKFYLSNVLKNADSLNFVSDIDKITPTKKKALFFATFSLNETEMDVRNKVESKLPLYDYIFIHFNRSFPVHGRDKEDINNIEYFANLKNRLMDRYNFIEEVDTLQKKYFMIGEKI